MSKPTYDPLLGKTLMHSHALADIPGIENLLWYGFEWDDQNATLSFVPSWN